MYALVDGMVSLSIITFTWYFTIGTAFLLRSPEGLNHVSYTGAKLLKFGPFAEQQLGGYCCPLSSLTADQQSESDYNRDAYDPSPRSFHLTDPTSLFNNDILRIASRTNARSNSNFNPIHAAEHAERMLLQMITMYQSSNRKKARPNIETFRIVLMGYANLKGVRWYKNVNENDDGISSTSLSSFGYTSSASTNTWGDEFIEQLSQQNEEQYNSIDDSREEKQSEYFAVGEGRFDDNDDKLDHSGKKGKSKTRMQICAADRVEFIMEQLMKLQVSEKEAGCDISSLELNTDTCNMCLLAYARCSYPQYDPLSAMEHDVIANDSKNMEIKDIGQSQQKQQQRKNPFLLPMSERGSYAQRAERLVKFMIFLSKDTDEPSDASQRRQIVEPNCQTFSYLIWSLSKQQPSSGAGNRRLNKSNNDDQSEYGSHQNQIHVDNNYYATRASEWVPHLEMLYKNNQATKGHYNHDRRLLRKYLLWAYSDILDAWSKCSGKKSPRKVYKFMTLLESLCEEDELELSEIQDENSIDFGNGNESKTYTGDHQDSFLTSWSSLTKPPGNDKYAPYLDRYTPLYPNSQCYTRTILSLSKSKEVGSAQRADQLLFKMLKIYESGKWGNNKPSIYAFNGVISAWANCVAGTIGNADKAERILNLMERLYFDESKPEYDHLNPDLVTFNTAIKAWTNSREDAAVLKAEALVERMEELYNGGFLDVKPDKYTYNTLITGWLRSDLGIASAENAESLLRKMVQKYLDGDQNLTPNQKIFSSIIDKWAKSDPSRNIAVKHSLGLLKLMELLCERGCTHLRPDKITYTNIIDAIARSRSPSGGRQALSLLADMEESYQNGFYNVKPSAQTYSCVLLSLLNSDLADKHLIAQDIPNRMREIGVSPNAFTWNYIIHVASSTLGSERKKMEAFKVALGAFQALRKSEVHNTDSFTYTFFLKALNHLVSDRVTRSSIAKETFLECANEGKVNDQVLARLVWAVPPEELRQVLGQVRISDIRNVKARDLPMEWGRNLPKKRKRKS